MYGHVSSNPKKLAKVPKLAAFRKAIVYKRKIMYCMFSYYFKHKHNHAP